MTDVNPILQWLNANPAWAGVATFLISACESIAIIGTIVPGTITMTAIGTLAGAGVIPLWATVVYAIVGAVFGDGISYWLGHHFKDRMRQIWPFSSHAEWLASGENFFRKHGGKSIFIGRFVGPVRAIVPVVAGMLGFTPLRFFAASIPAAIGWAPIYMLPGILLGAASLELPPDLAIHAILMVLLAVFCIVLCLWIVFKILTLIGNKIDQMLNSLWHRLQISRYSRFITIVLKHHNPTETHGQLVLGFYLALVVITLSYLAGLIATHGPQSLLINNAVFHFFRSLRSPDIDNIMIYLTLLGEKTVLIPVVFIVFGWLFMTNRRFLAWHVFALAVLTIGGIEILKHIAHSPRPWGIHALDGFSFPSGHTTLATTFFIGFALLLSQARPTKSRCYMYIALIIALAVSLSRLYLGAHWFTDVLGGWLLSAAVLMVTAISYNRRNHSLIKLTDVALVAFLALIICYSAAYLHYFNRFKQDYTPVQYPEHTLPMTTWWQHTDSQIPAFRSNRFGMKDQIFDIQWVGNLEKIKTLLLKNKWEIPPERNWISILQRVSDVRSSEHLPLVSPLHLDKKPVLVLIRHTADAKRVLILRLWDSNIAIQPGNQHLWVGTINVIPHTYNWLFRKHSVDVDIDGTLVFEKQPTEYVTKQIIAVSAPKKHKLPDPPVILLIKPKA